MTIAALQAQKLSLTVRQSDTEYELNIINTRRQGLATQSASMLEQYMKKAQAMLSDDTEITEEEETAFTIEYEAAQSRIDAQDTLLDLQAKDKEMEQKALSTQNESVDKQIQKNAEKEYNTSLG